MPKDDPRIEANGTLDELNCALGLVRASLEESHPWQDFFYRVQMATMGAMSLVATPSGLRDGNPNRVDFDSLIAELEVLIDGITVELGEEANYFVLPGGTLATAQLHMARAIARRAERRLWTLHAIDPVPEKLIVFYNRLSDLLFVQARQLLVLQGGTSERWKHFFYRRKTKEF